METEDPVTLGIIDNMVSTPINSAKVSIFGDSALTLDRKIGKKWEKSDAKSQLEEIAIPGVQCEVFSVQRGRPMAKLRDTIEKAAAASLFSDRKVWILAWTLNDFFDATCNYRYPTDVEVDAIIEELSRSLRAMRNICSVPVLLLPSVKSYMKLFGSFKRFRDEQSFAL